jgi:ribosomal protein L11 methylase PrmA
VDVQEAELGTFRGKAADVVVANLTGAVIQKYARQLAALISPGGRLIVSGFSVAEVVPVTAALAGVVEQELSEGDWAAALVRV